MSDPTALHIETEAKARQDAQRDIFRTYLAEWHTLRGRMIDPRFEDDGDEAATARSDRSDELARLITTTPAALAWMIFEKLEVLEHYLGDPDVSGWTDNREIVMLAGIKADLMRFEPKERRS